MVIYPEDSPALSNVCTTGARTLGYIGITILQIGVRDGILPILIIKSQKRSFWNCIKCNDPISMCLFYESET